MSSRVRLLFVNGQSGKASCGNRALLTLAALHKAAAAFQTNGEVDTSLGPVWVPKSAVGDRGVFEERLAGMLDRHSRETLERQCLVYPWAKDHTTSVPPAPVPTGLSGWRLAMWYWENTPPALRQSSVFCATRDGRTLAWGRSQGNPEMRGVWAKVRKAPPPKPAAKGPDGYDFEYKTSFAVKNKYREYKEQQQTAPSSLAASATYVDDNGNIRPYPPVPLSPRKASKPQKAAKAAPPKVGIWT